MGRGSALRLLALCLVIVAWGCVPPKTPEPNPPVVRGSGLPPTTLVAPFTPWSGSAPVPATGLLVDGEHVQGTADKSDVGELETLAPPTIKRVTSNWHKRLDVRFNREVCPTDEDASSVLTITPPTKGKARWERSDLLVFEPETPWPHATKIEVRVRAKLCSTASLVADDTHETVYRPLRRAWVKASGTLGKREGFEVSFSDSVTLGAVQAGVVVEELDAAGKPVRTLGMTARVATAKNKTTTDDTFVVSPLTDWPRDRQLRISVGENMRGLGGAPLELPREKVLRTWGPQRITAACSRSSSFENCTPGLADARGLEVDFRNGLAGRFVPGVVVTPRPKGMRMSLANKRRLVITGDFELGKTYEVTLPAGLRDRFGQRTTEKTTLEFEIGLPPPMIEIGVGEPREDTWHTRTSMRVDRATIGINTRRMKSVRVRIAKVPDDRLFDALRDKAAKVAKGLPAIVDETVVLNPKGPTQFASVPLNLAKMIGKHRGALVVTVSPADMATPDGDVPDDRHVLVQVGDLGLTIGESTAHGHEVRVASLADGKPVTGVEIAMVVTDEKTTTRRVLGKTDKAGHLHVAPPAPVAVEARVVIVARASTGEEAVIEATNWASRSAKSNGLLKPHESLLGHLITERGIYKPGETIHVVAWGKIGAPTEKLGRRAIPEGTELVAILELDEVLSRKKVKVNTHGKVVTSFALDAKAKPGRYLIRLMHKPSGQTLGTESVRVEHYQTPAFLTEVTSAKRDGLARATFRIAGKHYSGEPLDIVGATVGNTCYAGRPRSRHFGLSYDWDVGYTPKDSKSVVKMTASSPTMVKPAREVSVRLDGSSLTTGRSEVCGVKADLLARTLQSQSNARSPRFWFYGAQDAVAMKVASPKRKGQRYVVTLRSVTHVGADAKMKRIRWPEPVDVVLIDDEGARTKACTLRLGDRRDARCRLGKLEDWGSYTVEVRDQSGVVARTGFYKSSWPSWRSTTKKPPVVVKTEERCATYDGVKQCHDVDLNPAFATKAKSDELAIAPETEAVLVGEKARIAIVGPFKLAPGMLLVRTVGASQVVPFTITRGRAEVAVDVLPSWEADVELHAWVTPPPTGKTTATHHHAMARLDVIDRERSLGVRVVAPKKASVRETKTIEVFVTDKSGKPVTGRVAVWVSDRAVLDLTSYSLPYLHELTTHPELGDMSVHEDYDALRLPFIPQKEDIYFSHGAGTGTGQGFGSGHGRMGRSHRARAPRVRAGATAVDHERGDFRTTPLFVGDVATDAQGRASVELKLPDNITEFNVLAVASATMDAPGIPERFGRGRASIVVSKSLLVTAALPTHLRPGDTARIAAVVRNNLSTPVEVDVIAGVEGEALLLEGKTKQRVKIAATTSHRISFQVKGAKVGTAKVRLQADATGDPSRRDAVVLPLAVAEERLRYEEDGTQGLLMASEAPDERGVTVPVALQEKVAPSTVEARLSFGRSPITGLEGAAASLMRFPYGCVEQLSSKLLPLIAVEELRDLGLVDENPDVFIEATVSSILDKQREDGGFGLWSSTGDAHAYGSAYATWVLVMAKRGGVKVPPKALARAVEFAERMQADDEVKPEARALAMLALAEHGESPAWVAERVLHRVKGKLPTGAFELGVLAMSLRDAKPKTKQRVLKALMGMLVVRGDQAGVQGPALSHGAPMGARVPGTAALMMGLMALDPKAPILQKLATGLLAQRHRGRWLATQDNAFALLALSRYARLVGKPVDVRAKGWVGTTAVANEMLTDASPVARGAWSPLVKASGEKPMVTVQRIGKGPMHYMLRVRRMRAKGEIPKSRVLSLKRTLRTAKGVVGDSVVAGQVLALDVEWHAAQPVSYVAIDVPLPAGLEPAIAGLSTKLDRMLGDDKRAASKLINHQQAFPDRVVIFADRVTPGTHRHTIYVRAVTPGSYDFPAARAMAQYAPGVQGWSTEKKLTVAERTK